MDTACQARAAVNVLRVLVDGKVAQPLNELSLSMAATKMLSRRSLKIE